MQTVLLIKRKNMKSNFLKFGAVSANLAALSFVIGFALYFSVLSEAQYPRFDLAIQPQIEFMIENNMLLYSWYFIIYIVFGLCLILLNVSVFQWLKKEQSIWLNTTMVLAFVWTGLVIASGLVANVGSAHVIEVYNVTPKQAESLWLMVQTLINALGGGNEIVGGLWLLLLNLILLNRRQVSLKLSLIGIISGFSGVLTLLPSFQELGAIFGLGCIVWFGGLSVALINLQEDLI